jgi:hypothetical protein
MTMPAPTLRWFAGDIGEEIETREFEPMPQTVPVHEPSPSPAEPVPA